jgi:hypothetical protein
VLVSGSDDIYLEQAYVSAYSASKRNPGAALVLLTDQVTAEGCLSRNPNAGAFKALFSEIVVVPLDASAPGMKRSRLLKTGMRQYVKGDFLFIDADTIVSRSLEEVDTMDILLGACLDLHSPLPEHTHRDAIVSLCRKCGFDVSSETQYFNSGVMLVRDHPQTHEFFRRWQENYLAGYAAGVRSDQPSLARTNAETGHQLRQMDDFWNCQAMHGVRYLKDAFIVHYLCTNAASSENGYLFLLHDPQVLQRVRSEGLESLYAVIEDPFKGFAAQTQVFSGEDLHFFRTRRYRWLRSRYRRGGFSLLEFCLKVWDHLTGKV